MRLIVGSVVCVVLGGLVGLQHARWTEPLRTDLAAEVVGAPVHLAHAAGASAESSGTPQLVIDEGSVFHFGVMARDTKGTHRFKLRNAGTGPLRLEVKDTTCKCTLAELADRTLAAGKTTEVELEWQAQGYDDDFRHGATLSTNDPSQPTVMLTVEGRITHVIRPVPDRIRVDRMSVHDTRDFRVKLYSYRKDPLLLHSAQFSNSDLAKQFEYEMRPLEPAELASERDAQHGYQFDIRILPGLPMGAFHQTLLLTTNYDDMDVVEIPIDGTCVSDISILGPGYIPDTQVLHWGVIDGAQGDSRRVYLLVRGEHREGIVIEALESDPPGIFRVVVGEAVPYNKGLVSKVPVTIHVDPGHDPVSRLAGKSNEEYGHITFRTTHPDAPELRIYVRFGIK